VVEVFDALGGDGENEGGGGAAGVGFGGLEFVDGRGEAGGAESAVGELGGFLCVAVGGSVVDGRDDGDGGLADARTGEAEFEEAVEGVGVGADGRGGALDVGVALGPVDEAEAPEEVGEEGFVAGVLDEGGDVRRGGGFPGAMVRKLKRKGNFGSVRFRRWFSDATMQFSSQRFICS